METTQIINVIEAVTENNLNNSSVPLFDSIESTVNLAEKTASLNNEGNMVVTMTIYLIAVVLIVAGLLFVRKYLMNRLGAVKNGSYMRILDRLVIAQDKQIVLIELKNKILLVGITQQRIEALSEIDRNDFDVLVQESTDNQDGQKNSNAFVQMLSEKIRTVDKPDNKSNENDKK